MTIDDQRKQTHAKLVAMMAELRGGSPQINLDDTVTGRDVAEVFKSVFAAIKSDDDLAIFLASTVGIWMEKTGITNNVMVSLAGRPLIVAETIKDKA